VPAELGPTMMVGVQMLKLKTGSKICEDKRLSNKSFSGSCQDGGLQTLPFNLTVVCEPSWLAALNLPALA